MPEAPESSGNEIVAPPANTFNSLKSLFKESYGKCKSCGKTFKRKNK